MYDKKPVINEKQVLIYIEYLREQERSLYDANLYSTWNNQA